MIQKSKFSFIRAILNEAKALNGQVCKQNVRLQYFINSNYFFSWENEEEFSSFIRYNTLRVLKSNTSYKMQREKVTISQGLGYTALKASKPRYVS